MEIDNSWNTSMFSKSDVETTFDKFHPFPRLPIELRLKIWETACYQPRNLALVVQFIALREELFQGKSSPESKQMFRYHSNLRPPALLHATHESRIEGLKHYKLDFGVDNTMSLSCGIQAVVSIPPTIFINWAADRLCLGPEFRYLMAEPLWRKHLLQLCQNNKLQSMAYGFGPPFMFRVNDEEHILLTEFLKKGNLPSLKEVIFYQLTKPRLASAFPGKGICIEFVPREPKRVRDSNNFADFDLESIIKRILDHQGIENEESPDLYSFVPKDKSLGIKWLVGLSLMNISFPEAA